MMSGMWFKPRPLGRSIPEHKKIPNFLCSKSCSICLHPKAPHKLKGFLISKRGDGGMPMGIIMSFVVAAVVLGTVIFLIGTKLEGGSGILQSVKNILPNFGGEAPAASSEGLIAIELTDKDTPLRYYTGTSWAGFQKDASTVQIANVPVQINEARSALMDLYFKSDRKVSANIPMTESFKQLSFSLPLYWDKGQNYNYYSQSSKFDESGLYVHVVDELASRSLGVYRTDLFLRQDGLLFILSDDKVRRAKADELARYASYLPRIIEWRDNILQGNKCEKHTNIGGKQYAARIINQRNRIFLAVELSRPAEGREPWADCASSQDSLIKINHVPMSISFDSGSATHSYEWKLVGSEWKWVFQESSGKNTYADFVLSDGAEKSFYNGLRSIALKLKNDDSSGVISATFGPRVSGENTESLIAENLILAEATDYRLRVVSVDAFADYLTSQYYLYVRGENIVHYISDAQVMISFSPAGVKRTYSPANEVKGVLWGKPYGSCLQWYVLTKYDNYVPASFSNAKEFKMSREKQRSFGRGLGLIIQALDRKGPSDYPDVALYSATQNTAQEIVTGNPVVFVPNFDGEVESNGEKKALAEKSFELYKLKIQSLDSPEESTGDYASKAKVIVKGTTLFYNNKNYANFIGREERIATYDADNEWQFSTELYQNDVLVEPMPSSRTTPVISGLGSGFEVELPEVLTAMGSPDSAGLNLQWAAFFGVENGREFPSNKDVYFKNEPLVVLVGLNEVSKEISSYVVPLFSFDEPALRPTDAMPAAEQLKINAELIKRLEKRNAAVERVRTFYECARDGELS
ncbi:MAG: hypothetical protein AABX12_04285 [Nanoarchaeota archaeon]